MIFTYSRHNKNAFTLIEMITVVAIAALLMAVALPSVPGMIRNSKMSSTKNLIKTALAQAQSYAIRNGVNTGIRFQKAADGKTYLVLIENRNSYDFLEQVLATVPPTPVKTKKYQNNRYVAIKNAKPKPLPDGVSAISPDFLKIDTGIIDIETSLQNYPSDRGGVGLRNIEDLQTFSIIFAPSGQMVKKPVILEPRRDAFGALSYYYNASDELCRCTDDLYGDTTEPQFTSDAIFGSTLFTSPSMCAETVKDEYLREKRALLSYDNYILGWAGNVPITVNDDATNFNDALPWCQVADIDKAGELSVTSMLIYLDEDLADAAPNGTNRYANFFVESSYTIGATQDGSNEWAVVGKGKRDGCEMLLINKYTGELIETEE